MICRKFFAAALFCLCSLHHVVAAELESRTYRMRAPEHSMENRWEGCFTRFGVTWPEGARAYSRMSGRELVVINTPDNHRIIDRFLEVADVPRAQSGSRSAVP